MYNIDSQARFRPKPNHTVKSVKPSVYTIGDKVKGSYVMGSDVWYEADSNLGLIYIHSSYIKEIIQTEKEVFEEEKFQSKFRKKK